MAKVKYDTIGIDYNHARKADPYLSQRMFDLLKPQKDQLYLDIGCGTGNYTIAMQELGAQFTGVDPSSEMLGKGKARNSDIQWAIGTAENIPFEAAHFAGVLISLTIHHWQNKKAAFKEIARVLKPEANLVIFTTTTQQTGSYWLKQYFPKMVEDSANQLSSFEELESDLIENGFTDITTEKYNVKPDLQDHFLYCGKENPSIYLDPKIRHGISSFSALANAEEVDKGLVELEKDITSGKIKEVIAENLNAFGDYLFIRAKKQA